MKALISELLIRNLQKKYFKEMPANSFERIAASMDTVLESGVHFRSEIQYSEKYANSFFDIYYGAEENTTSLPTFINLHGGGFFMGSRATGDPLANAKAIGGTMMPDFAKNGFNSMKKAYMLVIAILILLEKRRRIYLDMGLVIPCLKKCTSDKESRNK